MKKCGHDFDVVLETMIENGLIRNGFKKVTKHFIKVLGDKVVRIHPNLTNLHVVYSSGKSESFRKLFKIYNIDRAIEFSDNFLEGGENE